LLTVDKAWVEHKKLEKLMERLRARNLKKLVKVKKMIIEEGAEGDFIYLMNDLLAGSSLLDSGSPTIYTLLFNSEDHGNPLLCI
jgi:hypothetical protein